MSEFTEDELERYTCKCLEVFFYVVYFVVVVAAFLLGSAISGFVILFLTSVIYFGIASLYERKKRVGGNPVSDRMNQPDQTPINSVSSSIPHAPLLTGQPPPLHIPSTWPSSLYSPLAPTLSVHHSPFNFASNVDAEAARRHAANLQPPPYPEDLQDSPGLPPPLYTTLATDEASAKVFGPSSDGLPSYEAAMSTWQPPADEVHPSRRDDE